MATEFHCDKDLLLRPRGTTVSPAKAAFRPKQKVRAIVRKLMFNVKDEFQVSPGASRFEPF
jgi:hypothetical protein